ncbi:hypothetical protein ALC56_13751, partial [Trachymyrmex septentrionalis]
AKIGSVVGNSLAGISAFSCTTLSGKGTSLDIIFSKIIVEASSIFSSETLTLLVILSVVLSCIISCSASTFSLSVKSVTASTPIFSETCSCNCRLFSVVSEVVSSLLSVIVLSVVTVSKLDNMLNVFVIEANILSLSTCSVTFSLLSSTISLALSSNFSVCSTFSNDSFSDLLLPSSTEIPSLFTVSKVDVAQNSISTLRPAREDDIFNDSRLTKFDDGGYHARYLATDAASDAEMASAARNDERRRMPAMEV